MNGALGTDDGTHGTGPDAAALKTIQYAINDGRVGNGDTINVAAGTYQEDITINKSLTLQGAGRTTTTILRKTSTDQVVDIEANDVTITGLKIDGGSGLACEYVVADYSYHNQITWCHLLNCWDMGIFIYFPGHRWRWQG